MARLALLCLILSYGILFLQAMASESETNPYVFSFQNEEETHHELPADQPASGPETSEMIIRRLGKHHSSSDKSVAGGGVIIGGLVTVIFAAVFCYIRVTRRKDGDDTGGK